MKSKIAICLGLFALTFTFACSSDDAQVDVQEDIPEVAEVQVENDVPEIEVIEEEVEDDEADIIVEPVVWSYEELSNATVGDYFVFGTYEQDGDWENGSEPIEWEILDVQKGKALVVTNMY